jgi:HlyD family secretion protein
VIKLSVANAQDSRVDKILVQEGDRVKRNQVIAILQGIDRKQVDLRDALADVKLREIELGRVSQGDVKRSQIVAQQAVITRLQAQLRSTRKQREAALMAARSRLQNADADYQRQDRADRQGLGLLTAQARLTNAEAEYRRRSQFNRSGDDTLGSVAKLRNAKEEYQRKLTLYRSGGISQSQLAKAQEEFTSAQAFAQERGLDTRTQLDRSRAELATARADLQEKRLETRSQLGRVRTELLTIKETVKERQAELDQSVQTLMAEISQEQAKLAELNEVRPADIRIAQAQLEKAKIAVEQKQAALRDSEVRVPVAGQILKINTRIGEQVNISQGIVELAQTEQMYAIAEVAEVDINKIHQGQLATITSEYGSFKGEGTVAQISLQVGRKQTQEASGNTPTTDKESRVVAVKIKISSIDSIKVARLTNLQVRVRLSLKP